MSETVGLSTSYPITIPSTTDDADIQVALKLIAYGQSANPTDDADIEPNSIAGALKLKAPLVSPSFTTPSLGVATATSINGTTIPSSKTLVYESSSGNISQNALTATTATNIAGGLANKIPYQTAAGTTSFISAPSDLQVLQYKDNAIQWVDFTTAGTISNAVYATSAGSVTNALTIGSGLSGTSFNGSSAVTIALSNAYGDTVNPYSSKTANYVLAAPNGSTGTPSFRALTSSDIPTLNQNTTGSAGSVLNSFIIKSDSGTTEGTDLYTFNGSTAKTLNFVAGSGISIAKTSGTLTFSNSGVRSISGTTNQITASASTGAVTLSVPSAVASGSFHSPINDYTVATTTAVGTVFGGSVFSKILTLSVNTVYYVDMVLYIRPTTTGGTISSLELLWGMDPTQTSGATSNLRYLLNTGLTNVNSTSTTTTSGMISNFEKISLQSSVTGYTRLKIEGIIKTNSISASAGLYYPYIQMVSASSGGQTSTIKTLAGSYIRWSALGSAASDVTLSAGGTWV